MTPSLSGWLAARRPSVPDVLRGRLEVEDGDGPASAQELARLAVVRLSAAGVAEPLDRGAAFQLLAADAFLTYACEAALKETDAASSLNRVLDHCVAAWP